MTASVTPSARSAPRTNVVLPAPSSPDTSTTSPGRSCAASPAPARSVASGSRVSLSALTQADPQRDARGEQHGPEARSAARCRARCAAARPGRRPARRRRRAGAGTAPADGSAVAAGAGAGVAGAGVAVAAGCCSWLPPPPSSFWPANGSSYCSSPALWASAGAGGGGEQRRGGHEDGESAADRHRAHHSDRVSGRGATDARRRADRGSGAAGTTSLDRDRRPGADGAALAQRTRAAAAAPRGRRRGASRSVPARAACHAQPPGGTRRSGSQRSGNARATSSSVLRSTQAPGPRTAARALPRVRGDGARLPAAGPAGEPEPQAEVDVLEVHPEPLVEAAGGGDARAPVQRRAGAGGEHLARRVVGAGVALEAAALLARAVAPQDVAGVVEQRGVGEVDELRRDRRRARVPAERRAAVSSQRGSSTTSVLTSATASAVVGADPGVRGAGEAAVARRARRPGPPGSARRAAPREPSVEPSSTTTHLGRRHGLRRHALEHARAASARR